jgi:uncharacterized ParB-like nuclease family protein
MTSIPAIMIASAARLVRSTCGHGGPLTNCGDAHAHPRTMVYSRKPPVYGRPGAGASRQPPKPALFPSPRDSAELRTPLHQRTDQNSSNSPPFGQPTSPPPGQLTTTEKAPANPQLPAAQAKKGVRGAVAQHQQSAAAVSRDAAARRIQRVWRRAGPWLRLRRVHAAHESLRSQQSALQATNTTKSDRTRAADVLQPLQRARDDTAAFVQRHRALARDKDQRRRAQAARQRAALKIQTQWRLRQAEHIASGGGGGGSGGSSSMTVCHPSTACDTAVADTSACARQVDYPRSEMTWYALSPRANAARACS